jgi:meso-butanediol dehydrogenase / (S,S)-butanediol dehydrogenase / diacetyl reductase
MRLKDRVAVVTGGAAGIGEGICMCLAREGADVVVSDIDIDGAERVAFEVRKAGRKALAVKTDVRKWEDCQQFVAKALDELGRLDILVCNAGTIGIPRGYTGEGDPLLLENLPIEIWDIVHDVNLKGTFLSCRAVAPHFKKQQFGKIINMSSTTGRRGSNFFHYCSTKAAVIVFSQAISLQLAPFNINVNTVCPGQVWTPLWDHQASFWKQRNPSYEGMSAREIFDHITKAKTPLGRAQTPEDVGNLVAFLASEEAKEITGQAINVDGGKVFS